MDMRPKFGHWSWGCTQSLSTGPGTTSKIWAGFMTISKLPPPTSQQRPQTDLCWRVWKTRLRVWSLEAPGVTSLLHSYPDESSSFLALCLSVDPWGPTQEIYTSSLLSWCMRCCRMFPWRRSREEISSAEEQHRQSLAMWSWKMMVTMPWWSQRKCWWQWYLPELVFILLWDWETRKGWVPRSVLAQKILTKKTIAVVTVMGPPCSAHGGAPFCSRCLL